MATGIKCSIRELGHARHIKDQDGGDDAPISVVDTLHFSERRLRDYSGDPAVSWRGERLYNYKFSRISPSVG